MYKVKFKNISRKSIGSCPWKLKRRLKKEFSILEAENLIKEVAACGVKEITLSLEVEDVDDKTVYGITEKKIMKIDADIFSLINYCKKEVIESISAEEDDQEYRDFLERMSIQYKEECLNCGKKDLYNEPDVDLDTNEDEELDAIDIDETEIDSFDFQDISIDIEENSTPISDFNENEKDIKALENALFGSKQSDNQITREDNLHEVYHSTKSEFPELNSYLDIPEITIKETHFDGIFDSGTLKKGIDLDEALRIDEDNEIIQKQNEFINKVLEGPEVLSIKINLLTYVDDIKAQIKDKLTEIYDNTLTHNYELTAEENVKSEIEDKNLLRVKELDEYRKSLQQANEPRINTFLEQQKADLEAFKAKQKAALDEFRGNLSDQEETKFEIYKSELSEKFKHEKEMLINNKIEELKKFSSEILIDEKQKVISKAMENINDLMKKAKVELEKVTNDIEVRLKKYLPKWREEIEQKRNRELLEKELQCKEAELELEKSKLELQKEDKSLSTPQEVNNFSTAPEPTGLSEKLKVIEEELKNYKSKNQELEEKRNQEKLRVKESRKNIYITLFASISIILFLLLVFIVSLNVFAKDKNKEGVSQYNQAQISDEAKSEIYEAQEGQPNDEWEIGEDNIENIESVLFEKEELELLKVICNKYETAFGRLDVALLEKDAEKAMEYYGNLSEDEKKRFAESDKRVLLLSELLVTDINELG